MLTHAPGKDTDRLVILEYERITHEQLNGYNG